MDSLGEGRKVKFEWIDKIASPWVGNAPSFIVGAMCTPSHKHLGMRLYDSCIKFNIPIVLYIVPEVHRSISVRGGFNLAYTKSFFIRHLLDIYARPVLYIDSDCIVEKPLGFIEEIQFSKADFGIYNWLADNNNETFVPVEDSRILRSAPQGGRYYRFSHFNPYCSEDYLICSGAVQYHSGSPVSLSLLIGWQEVVKNNPMSADDHCLDLAYNRMVGNANIKVKWLEKSQARYAWWIMTEPIINHPSIPSPGIDFVPITDYMGGVSVREVMLKCASRKSNVPLDCIVDVLDKNVIWKDRWGIVQVRKIGNKLWP